MFSKKKSQRKPLQDGDLPPSPGERVFRSWELVLNIFRYLPWSDVCRLRNLSPETRNACQYTVQEVDDPEAHDIREKDFYDFILAVGAKGCHNLLKIDVQSSPNISTNILPILKFCGNIEHLALTKNYPEQDLYMSMVYNTDIKHLSIKATELHFFQDVDLVDILLILQNITKLELINTGITDTALTEISDEMKTLTLLNVSGCLGITDRGLRQIINNCPKLTHLNVQNTPTMKDCVERITNNYTIQYLNALETNLLPKDARVLKKHFEDFHRPFVFLWSRTKLVNQTYELETVREVNKPIIDGYKRMSSEEIFDQIHIDDHLWDNAETVKNRPIEMTAQQYLTELRETCTKPLFNQSQMVIHNWAERAFKDKELTSPCYELAFFARQLGFGQYDEQIDNIERYRRRIEISEHLNEDIHLYPEENVTRLDDGILAVPHDSGWKRIYEVQENLTKLKKEYEVLMNEFQTFGGRRKNRLQTYDGFL